MENEYFSVPSHQLSYNNYREKFYTGKLSPEVQLLTFYVSFLHKRYSFRIPFHSSLMVEGSSGLLQAFYSQRVLNKVFYGEALPRFPFPYLSTYHFCRKRFSFRIPNHPSWRLRVEWLVAGILKWAQTIQGSIGRKTALSKSNLWRYFAVSFFSNKIVLTHRNL